MLTNNIHDELGFIDAATREKGERVDTLMEDQKTIYMEQGQEQMMAMHMLTGADWDRFGSTIEDFECTYLMDRKNAYPKTLHDSYMHLKGWRKQPGMRQHPLKMGVLFNTIGDSDNDADGTSLVNQGNKYKGPLCSQCGQTNHPIEKCIPKKHKNEKLLHVDSSCLDGYTIGEVSENAFGIISGNAYNLMFVHSNTKSSQMTQKLSSRGGIPSTWILLEVSQLQMCSVTQACCPKSTKLTQQYIFDVMWGRNQQTCKVICPGMAGYDTFWVVLQIYCL